MKQKVNVKSVDDLRLPSCGDRGRGLSETLKTSLHALREHSSELLFENQSQAICLLMRVRNVSRSAAYLDVHRLGALRLIKFEKPKDDLQPLLLEIVPAEAVGEVAGPCRPPRGQSDLAGNFGNQEQQQ